jgi:hypothetical protein
VIYIQSDFRGVRTTTKVKVERFSALLESSIA